MDDACDARMIEESLKPITSDPENMPDIDCWVDLFYCHDRIVRLVGTWVIKPGIDNAWHSDGWSERPRPSKERSLRYLHELGRPI